MNHRGTETQRTKIRLLADTEDNGADGAPGIHKASIPGWGPWPGPPRAAGLGHLQDRRGSRKGAEGARGTIRQRADTEAYRRQGGGLG